MKKRILAGAAALGLSALVAGVGPAFAGGGGIAPQDHWTWRSEAVSRDPGTSPSPHSVPTEAMETGTLPRPDAGKHAETGIRPSPQEDIDPAVFNADPRWKESGG